MEIAELNREQQAALVALVEAVTLSDGMVTDGERQEIGKLAGALGDDLYRELLEEVNVRYPTIDALKEYLASVQDAGARDLIHGILLEETIASPSVDGQNSAMLRWLQDTWSISVSEG